MKPLRQEKRRHSHMCSKNVKSEKQLLSKLYLPKLSSYPRPDGKRFPLAMEDNNDLSQSLMFHPSQRAFYYEDLLSWSRCI